MLGLRRKLSLGFGGLFVIMIAIGLQSVLHLSNLGESIDIILRENYRSVIACQEMKESLERIDSGVLFMLLGDAEKGREQIQSNTVNFERALQAELNNITLPGEGEKGKHVRELFTRYKMNLDSIEHTEVPLAMRKMTYFSDLLPLFKQIKDAADEILRMNQQSMSDANDRARHRAATATKQMYVLLFAGTFIAIGFVLLTGRWILHPINRLIKSADEIGRGNLDLVLDSSSRDEIGHLSEAFNAMAANLREFRRSDQARLFRVQRATQQAFDSLSDAIAVLDFEGRVEVATTLAKDIFGLEQGIAVQDLQFPSVTDICQRALKTGHPAVPRDGKTILQQFVKGEERFFQPEATPIVDSQGQPTGLVLVLKDVTQMRQQDELKMGIISTVSHQLKTPLTSIRMAIHLLLEDSTGSLTNKQVELLLAAREESDRLHKILNNLLDISRIESGKATMKFQEVYPNGLVLDAIERFAFAAQDKGVSLKANLETALPNVWADPTQIGHVFSNLLTNALRYTDAGGDITISATADNDGVQFRVTDTGRGIPPEHLAHIFERFFRVPEQASEPGAGLGLAIVKEIVEAHGGTVTADSLGGKGSAFTFTLRRADRISRKEHIP